MNELLQIYWDGLQHLFPHLDEEKVSLADTLKHRLFVIISEVKLGITDTLRHELAEIVSELNELTRKVVGTDFIEFCRSCTEQTGKIETPATFLVLAHNCITSACDYISAIHLALYEASILFQREEIWPTPCQNVILAFLKHEQPSVPENIPFGSLEEILTFMNKQVQILAGLINNFAPYGRDKTAKASRLKQNIRQEIQKFPQYLKVAIDCLNLSARLVNYPNRCVLVDIDKDNLQ